MENFDPDCPIRGRGDSTLSSGTTPRLRGAPAIPVHVLTAGGVSGPNVKSVRRVHEAWKAAVIRAVNAKYTNVPASGHYMTSMRQSLRSTLELVISTLQRTNDRRA